MSLKFSLKCSRGLWRRHFWWQTVPSFCCSNRERLVANRGIRVSGTASTWGRWRAPQALSTKNSDVIHVKVSRLLSAKVSVKVETALFEQ